jgi:site-specific DNA recombinase
MKNNLPQNIKKKNMLQNIKTKKRAVIYIRYSSHRQADSFSIEYQVDACTKLIELNEYKLVGTYIDEAKSAKQVAGRDQFDAMMEAAALDEFDTIIVFSFSRSFRNTRDALNYNHELMENYGITIESVIEKIDLTNPHGKFSGTNLFAMHELQSDIIAAFACAGMYVAAGHGYYLGGYVPFGFRLYETGELTRGKMRRKYEPDPVESEIIKEVFKLYADGYSLTYIQSMLRDRNVCGRKGGIIGLQTIARILKSSWYIGIREYQVKGHEILYVQVPAIIDMDTWNAVQIRHNENKLVKPRRKKRLYSLTGKITCAKCGGHMVGSYKGDSRAKNDHYTYYHCSTKKTRRTCDAKNIRKDLLDSYCLSQIKEHILTKDAMENISAQIANIANSEPEKMKKKRIELEKRKEKIDNILMKIQTDVYEEKITEERGNKLAAKYNDEFQDIELKLYSIDNALSKSISVDNVYSYLNDILNNIDSEDEEIRKTIYDKVIEKIVIHDDKVELFLIVFPFAINRDKKLLGQPCYTLSLTAPRVGTVNSTALKN